MCFKKIYYIQYCLIIDLLGKIVTSERASTRYDQRTI